MHFRIQRFEIVVLHYVDCTEIREIVCFHSYEYIALKHFKLARDIQASFVVLELCTGDLHMNFASNKLSEVMCFFHIVFVISISNENALFCFHAAFAILI